MNGCEIVCPCPIGSGESLNAALTLLAARSGRAALRSAAISRSDNLAADFRGRVAHVLLDGADHIFLHLHRDILKRQCG
jgi:hypothetical protein